MGIDDQEEILDEEAIAEEEFIADPEETIKDNPLVYDDEKVEEVQGEIEVTGDAGALTGAIGTGNLTFGGGPFNNEEALRSESVSNDENPFGENPSSEGPFGGPDTAPLSDATETIEPAAAKQDDTFGATDLSAETGATATPAAAEPTIADLAQEAAAAPASTSPAADTPVATSAPAVAEAAKPKKKKTGLIIGIIIVVILLLGAAIGGIIFYNTHEAKERVLSDAMAGIWSADARQFDGTVSIEPKKADTLGFKNMKLSFKSDNKAANFSGSGSLTVNLSDDNSLSVDLAGAYISSDGIFFKIDKLEEAVNDFDLSSLFGDSAASDKEMVEMYVDLFKDTIKGVAKEIDGTWYKIDASTFSSDKNAKKTYDCVTEALDSISSSETKNKITDIYKAHPFVEFEEGKDSESADGLTYYYVKTNEEEYKSFGDDVSELDAAKKLESCFDNSSSSSDIKKKKDETKVEASVKLGIKGWTHELLAAKGNATSSDGTKLDFDIKIGYEDKSISAPTGDAVNVADAAEKLVDSATNSLKKSFPKFAKKMCEKEYAGNQQLVNLCIQEFEKQMDSFIKETMGEIGGGIVTTSTLLKEE